MLDRLVVLVDRLVDDLEGPDRGLARPVHDPATDDHRRGLGPPDRLGARLDPLLDGPLADDHQAAGRELGHRRLAALDRLDRVRRDDQALLRLDPAGAEIDLEVLAAEHQRAVRRGQGPQLQGVLAVGVDDQVAAVAEDPADHAVVVEPGEPLVHQREVGVAEVAPAPVGDVVHQLAEQQLAVGRPDRLEQPLTSDLEPVLEAARVGEQPVAAPPAAEERLGVGQPVLAAPASLADLDDVLRGRELLDARRVGRVALAVRRRGLLEHRRRLLPVTVVADPPAVGPPDALGLVERERGREQALEGHDEQVGHGRGGPDQYRAARGVAQTA